MSKSARRLESADPMRHMQLLDLPDNTINALTRETIMHATRTHTYPLAAVPADVRAARARRRGRLIAGLLTAAAVAVPTAAAAALGGMHSGFFGGDGGEEVQGEEWLYTDEPEIRQVVQDLADEVPLPPGASLNHVVARYPTEDRALVQRGGLAQEVASHAACEWYKDWEAGDSTRRAQDQRTIDSIASWSYWRMAFDSQTGRDPGREVLRRIAGETERGDATTLRQFIIANC